MDPVGAAAPVRHQPSPPGSPTPTPTTAVIERQVAVGQVPAPRTGLLPGHRGCHVGQAYTPEDTDALADYLRATATYDGPDEGEGKTAMMVSEFTVAAD